MTDTKWLLLALLTLSGAASAAPLTYQIHAVEGWTVNIDTRLTAKNQAATDKALALLKAQLKEVVLLVPPGPVAQLRRVALWLSPQYAGQPPKAEYHPSHIWLSQNGRNPAMARGIEFSNVLVYEAETQRMPMFVLHELAHAYQDQFLGDGNADLHATFARATASGTYDRVERFHGPGRDTTFERAYGMNDAREFFAEMTEAFFGRNDYYPFNRDELSRHDPTTLAMLQKAWQAPAARASESPGFDSRCHYRLTTLWQGEDLSLDIINDGRANNTPILAKTEYVSGQLWKLTPVGACP